MRIKWLCPFWVWQSLPLRLIHYGGFDKIKAAVPYALI